MCPRAPVGAAGEIEGWPALTTLEVLRRILLIARSRDLGPSPVDTLPPHSPGQVGTISERTVLLGGPLPHPVFGGGRLCAHCNADISYKKRKHGEGGTGPREAAAT